MTAQMRRRLLAPLAIAGAVTAAIPSRASAQVRPMVLEDSARPGYILPPRHLPVRRASLTRLWEIPALGTVHGGMAADHDGIVYAVREGVVRRVEAATGAPMWEVALDESLPLAPAHRHGVIVVAGERTLSAIRGATGETVWRVPLPAPALFSPGIGDAVAAVALQDGSLLACDLGSGATSWRQSLGCRPSTPPGAGDGLVVEGCGEGKLLAFEETSGIPRWERLLGDALSGQPLVSGGRVYAGTEGNRVLSLGTRRGKSQYTVRVAADPVMPLAIHGGTLLVGALDNLFYGFRQRHGHLAWRVDIGSRVQDLPAVLPPLAVHFPPQASEIVLIDLRDGQVVGREPQIESGRISSAGPVFSGAVLVLATQPVGGGVGWITAFSVEVESPARAAALAPSAVGGVAAGAARFLGELEGSGT